PWPTCRALFARSSPRSRDLVSALPFPSACLPSPRFVLEPDARDAGLSWAEAMGRSSTALVPAVLDGPGSNGPQVSAEPGSTVTTEVSGPSDSSICSPGSLPAIRIPTAAPRSSIGPLAALGANALDLHFLSVGCKACRERLLADELGNGGVLELGDALARAADQELAGMLAVRHFAPDECVQCIDAMNQARLQQKFQRSIDRGRRERTFVFLERAQNVVSPDGG